MSGNQRDVEKERYWQGTIREATRSGLSIREFCRQRQLKESQFYWWQRRLKQSRQPPRRRKPAAEDEAASFALVSDEPGTIDAGLELVFPGGRRLRIRKGVDEETLRAVLAVVDNAGC